MGTFTKCASCSPCRRGLSQQKRSRNLEAPSRVSSVRLEADFHSLSFSPLCWRVAAFGASGGYIAGSHELISALRLSSHAQNYAEAMSPPILAQIVTSMGSIMGPSAVSIVPALGKLPAYVMDGRDGQDRLRRLAFNSRYLSNGLRRLGFIVYGAQDSPIVPMLLFAPAKMGTFSRLMLERYKIIVVVVAYPACVSSVPPSSPLAVSQPLLTCPLCVLQHPSRLVAGALLRLGRPHQGRPGPHPRRNRRVGTVLGLKLSPRPERVPIDEVIRTGVETVRETERQYDEALMQLQQLSDAESQSQ